MQKSKKQINLQPVDIGGCEQSLAMDINPHLFSFSFAITSTIVP